jgi:hypothetical protein
MLFHALFHIGDGDANIQGGIQNSKVSIISEPDENLTGVSMHGWNSTKGFVYFDENQLFHPV